MKQENDIFDSNIEIIGKALRSIDAYTFQALLADCEETLRSGKKVITSGLGKNVPICDKFVGTMLSLGLDAAFLHTNSAVHGDMGMVHSGDLIIVLTKSGSTSESIYLTKLLQKRKGVKIWLLTFSSENPLSQIIEDTLVISLSHEGDLWNIVPNNSTTVYLIILQTLAIELSRKMHLSLEDDFKPNHPGGAIGERLKNEKQ